MYLHASLSLSFTSLTSFSSSCALAFLIPALKTQIMCVPWVSSLFVSHCRSWNTVYLDSYLLWMLIFPYLLLEEPLCKNDQLSCAFLSSRTIFLEKVQTVLLSKKSALVFSTEILIFALFISCEILYSVVSWSLLPRLPYIFTLLITSFSVKEQPRWIFDHLFEEIFFNTSTNFCTACSYPSVIPRYFKRLKFP